MNFVNKERFLVRMLQGTLGVIFISHGIARFYFSSLEAFGQFLETNGFPFGFYWAWIITIFEIIGGLLLILNYKAKVALIFHGIVILFGMLLVHIKNGWFVVGHGEDGVEYSVLILITIIFLFFTTKRGKTISTIPSKKM